MRQAELVQALGAVFRRLLQPLDHLRLVVQLGLLARHNAQDHNLVLGQVTERGEIAGSRIVELEEVHVDVEPLEEGLGHGLVAALGEPLRAEVAAAQVDADGHVLGPLADGGVDDVDALLGQLGGGLAVALGGLLAHALVTEVGQVGVVQLDEAAAGGVQVVELGLVGLGDVVEEGFERGVGVGVDGVAPAAEVHHGRAGNAHLDGDGLAGARRGLDGLHLLVHVVEVVDLDGVRVAQLADNDESGRSHAVRGDVGGRDMAALLDAGQMLEEVDVEPRAAVFTVGHGLEAVLDLFPDDDSNVLVLDLAQILGGGGLALDLFTGLEDGLGAEEGPDVVRAVNSGRKRHR